MSLLLLLSSAFAATFHQLEDLPHLAQHSVAVVRGVVIEADTRNLHGTLETRYVIAVDETLSGTPLEEVELSLPGGRQGELTQRFSGVPVWSEGQEVVYFVPQEKQRFYQEQRVLTLDNGRIHDALERGGIPSRLSDFRLQIRTPQLRP